MLQQGGNQRSSRLDVLLKKKALQQSPEAQNLKWSAEDQALIDWILAYIKTTPTVTRHTYIIFEKEIALGPNSPRAKSRELQEGLKLMKLIIEQQLALKRRSNDAQRT